MSAAAMGQGERPPIGQEDREALDGPDRSEAASRVDWEAVVVDGHRVRYGVAGSGAPALFLHGWGLRPNAYRRSIQAMSRAGCRVYAPALPGFGRHGAGTRR